MNVVFLQGCLSSPPSSRTLPSGDVMVTFEVTTRLADGRAATVPVAWPAAPRRAAGLPAGAEVVVTGQVRRRFFKAGGATASRTEVLATDIVPVRHAARATTAIERARHRIVLGTEG